MNGTPDATSGTRPEPMCYRLPEAGRILGGISRRLVSNLIHDGHLDVTWVGSIRMVTAESVRRYVSPKTEDKAAR